MLEADSVIETRGRKGSFVVEPATLSVAERADSLAAAADALVVAARQLGAERAETERALRDAWVRW